MPYLGNTPSTSFATVVKDSFNGGSTAYTLSKVATTNSVSVFVENVRQEPTTAYSVSGTTLTFTATTPSGTGNIYVLHMNPTTTTTHPASQALTATTGTFTSTVDINGNELILDADADTSITADTDDEIHIKIAGADDFKFKANTLEVQTGSNIDMNGTELILDADADTSITADTDDRIDFKTGGTDRLQIQSTSGNNVVIADGLTLTDGNLIVANGHGIDFSAESGDGPSVTSELLDSYEEGHIGTIGISVSGSDVVDSTNSNKYYVKVGRVVHLYFHIVLNGTMPAGTYSLTGMPFTSSNSNPAHRGAGVANAQDASSSYGQDGNYVSVRTNENSTSLTIYVPVQYVSEDRINLYASYVTAS